MAPDGNECPNLLALGRAIKLTREQKSMRANDLAVASGVPRERLESLEAGQLDPTYELLVDIAAGLDTQPSALVIFAEQLDDSMRSDSQDS